MSTDGKHWWEYVDPTVTLELLDGMCCKLPYNSVILSTSRKKVFEKDLQVINQLQINQRSPTDLVFTHFFMIFFRTHT